MKAHLNATVAEEYPRSTNTRTSAVRALRIAFVLACALLSCGHLANAQANNLFTLDAAASSPGNVVEDAAGTAYVAWVHEAAGGATSASYCKIPRGGSCAAPISLAASGQVTGAFPVLGTGSTVYVVAPLYPEHGVVLWTSTDGGQSFGAGVVHENGYSNKTDPTDVLLRGSTFYIGARNAGLGFSTFGGTEGDFTFGEAGAVAGSSFAFDGSGNPVEAYWADESGPGTSSIRFYRYNGSGGLDTESNWTPKAAKGTEVGPGYEPSLAGGASGLLLAYQDASQEATAPLLVRKYNGTAFGAPVMLDSDPTYRYYESGVIAQSPSGEVAVAWPWSNSSVIRLFLSTDGGATFSPGSAIASTEGGGNDVHLAVASDGQGWVTFLDEHGLELADLNPLTPQGQQPGPGGSTGNPPSTGTTATPTGTTTSPKPTATSITHSVNVAGNVVTLSTPGGCVRAGVVRAVLSVRSAKRKGKLVVKIYKVVFSVDGKTSKTVARPEVLRTLKVNPQPFRAVFHLHLTPDSSHTLSAHAFIKIHHGPPRSYVLKARFQACA
jgi:hypothetical protein